MRKIVIFEENEIAQINGLLGKIFSDAWELSNNEILKDDIEDLLHYIKWLKELFNHNTEKSMEEIYSINSALRSANERITPFLYNMSLTEMEDTAVCDINHNLMEIQTIVAHGLHN